jgi:hypothetical protein
MIGSYASANFSAKADNNGNVEIADPTVPNGGSVAPEPRQALPQHGIDLPDIAFGAQTTLAYTRNAAGTSGLLTVATAATRRRLRSSAATSPEASLLPPTAMAAPWSHKRCNQSSRRCWRTRHTADRRSPLAGRTMDRSVRTRSPSCPRLSRAGT